MISTRASDPRSRAPACPNIHSRDKPAASPRDLLAIGDQARAAGAGDQFAVENGEPISHSLFSVLFRSRAHLETQTEYRISTGTTLVQRATTTGKLRLSRLTLLSFYLYTQVNAV